MTRLVALGLIVGVALGCAGPVTRDSAPSPAVAESPVGWRLIQRPYGSVTEAWGDAGYAAIDPTSEVLVFEPVFEVQVDKPEGASKAVLCTEYQGPSTCAVGDLVNASVWVEGPKDRWYALRIEALASCGRIHRLAGAVPLAGEPDCYLVRGGSKVALTFTSTEAGLAGLRIAIDREILSGVAPSRASDNR